MQDYCSERVLAYSAVADIPIGAMVPLQECCCGMVISPFTHMSHMAIQVSVVWHQWEHPAACVMLRDGILHHHCTTRPFAPEEQRGESTELPCSQDLGRQIGRQAMLPPQSISPLQ